MGFYRQWTREREKKKFSDNLLVGRLKKHILSLWHVRLGKNWINFIDFGLFFVAKKNKHES